MTETQDTITGTVENLAFGGSGILKQAGLVVFVPFTAPGDLVTCRITKRKKNFAQAELLSIDRPSPLRTSPPCPYFGTCGGCQLQHLNYGAQLEQKRLWVEDSLKRIGRLDIPPVPAVVPAELQWAYRRHISLNLTPVEQGYTAGYIAMDNTTLIAVNQCPIFAAPGEAVIEQLQELAQQLESLPGNFGKVTLFKGTAGRYLCYFHFKRLPGNAKAIGESALRLYSCFQGIQFSAPKQSLTLGNTTVTLEIEGLSFQVSPRSFVQNHPEQSLNIYKALCAEAKSGQKGLDLYCGIGISSLFLARQGLDITGVENNPEAIKLARANAQHNGISTAHFVQGDVKAVLDQLLQETQPDLVILNPPREGLDPEVIEILKKNAPTELIYISCMPPTLARDLHLLVGGTYHIKKCQAFDMFPQTAHVETLVQIVKIS